MPTASVTAQQAVNNWTYQLDRLFRSIEERARPAGWTSDRGTTAAQEDPFGLGASLAYEAPVLKLRRPDPQSGSEQRITFEPRHRFTIGAAGRIDVYSYPRFREAMLLRTPDIRGADNLTWEEAEERVADAPWRAFSPERLPLSVDLEDDSSLRQFLDDLVA